MLKKKAVAIFKFLMSDNQDVVGGGGGQESLLFSIYFFGLLATTGAVRLYACGLNRLVL